MSDDRIVAVGLLTRRDVQLLGNSFDRLWPVDKSPAFDGLLEAIDEADRKLRAAPSGEANAKVDADLPHKR